MKLYTLPGACSLSCHIVLRWLQVPFDVEVVDRERIKSPAYLALNPSGAVPVLEDDDLVLTENVAILNYLADLHPDSGLGGDGSPRSRALVNRWLCHLNADVHKAFLPLFGPGLLLEDASQHPALAERARGRIRDLFARLDARLGQTPWLAGEHRSLADPYLFVTWRWARGKGVDLNGLAHLDAFGERMHHDPGVTAAMAAEGL